MSRRLDKNQTILKTLLREPANGTCADCKTAAHPRWASWNLGIFICIRCSGIHRSMGTHISRVKSVDLDTWTDEQVRSMVSWGNDKANQFWEHGLPTGYVPDESKIENFIRTKYDMKKWAQSSSVPDPSQMPSSAKSSTTTPVKTQQPNQQKENRKSLNNNLLDLEFTTPVSSRPHQSTQSQSVNSQHRHHHQQPHSHHRPPSAQHPSQQNNRDRPELKKSILSLYSTPLAASNSTPNFPLQQNQQQTTPFVNQSTSSVNQLSSLNFNSNPSFQQNQWNNSNTTSNVSSPSSNFSSTSNLNIDNGSNHGTNGQLNSTDQWTTLSSLGQSTRPVQSGFNGNNGLDDDLFKNVWK